MSDIKIEASLIQLVDSSLLYIHTSWCCWHEGVRLFDDGYPGAMLDVNHMRDSFLAKQGHNPQAMSIIHQASNNELRYALSQIEPRVETEHLVSIHFRWVAYHEGQRGTFLDFLEKGQYKEIRDVYCKYQHHNSDARNLLACVSNAYIKDLIDAI